jgi:hypothetical protein
MTPPDVDLFRSELDAHDCVFAERPEKTGQWGEMTDADRVCLRFGDARHADPGSQPGRALHQGTA